MHTKSLIEVVTTETPGPMMQTALELDIKSTGNSERNTIEIVFAGLGFVAIGGNFGEARIRVLTPQGRGVGLRKPVVQRIMGGYSLDVVKRKKVGRLILQRKDWGRDEDGRFRWETAKEKSKVRHSWNLDVEGSGGDEIENHELKDGREPVGGINGKEKDMEVEMRA